MHTTLVGRVNAKLLPGRTASCLFSDERTRKVRVLTGVYESDAGKNTAGKWPIVHRTVVVVVIGETEPRRVDWQRLDDVAAMLECAGEPI